MATILLLLFLESQTAQADGAYLDTALKAGWWLKEQAQETPEGKIWPTDPLVPETQRTDLYNGSAGVVLFFSQLYKATHQKMWLNEAEAGGNYLLSTLPDSLDALKEGGLYSGLSGIGFVLEELFKASGNQAYRNGALKCTALIEACARDPQKMAQPLYSDIISGNAGTGLFLLEAARTFHPEAIQTAEILGRALIDSAIKEGEPGAQSWSWRMRPDFSRLMPNFSHGTAGIVFFLARLYEDTGDKVWLNAALAGARRLKSLVNKDGFIYHHPDDGKDLYYLGWCHGPVGSSRTWEQLYKVTNDPQWAQLKNKSLNSLMAIDPSKNRTPGFWNNVGVCCGSAGIANCLLNDHLQKKNEQRLDMARKISADIINRATPDGQGLKWIQAEHRVKPELLIAQTGYMQGAAGIGLWMLQMDAAVKNKTWDLRFPDEPI